MPRLEQPEREWLTPEEADTIVNNLITTMILEGYGPEIITLVRDHLRATLEPLVRVQYTGETT